MYFILLSKVSYTYLNMYNYVLHQSSKFVKSFY